MKHELTKKQAEIVARVYNSLRSATIEWETVLTLLGVEVPVTGLSLDGNELYIKTADKANVSIDSKKD